MTTKREFQRIFEFLVKYHEGVGAWSNRDIRKFLRWAIFYKRLFIIHDDATPSSKRIVAVAVAWRVETPMSWDFDNLESMETGDTLYVFNTTIHPDYRKKGVLFALLSLALWRYQGVSEIYWENTCRDKVHHYKITKEKLLRLLTHAKKTTSR